MKVKILKKPDKINKELEKLAKIPKGDNLVMVGLPKASNAYPDGTSVIAVGIIHEFGSPSNNIPQRSFLRSTINIKSKEYKVLLGKLAKKIVSGDRSMKESLGLLGLQAQGDVQKMITDITDPPLKVREGNPLVDTGHLRQSITFEVDSSGN